VLSTRTSGTSRRRRRVAKLVRKASTRRYLSFDPVTEHIASEMCLILRSSNKVKAGVFCRASLDLPSAACPTLHGVWQMYARLQGGLTLPDATVGGSLGRAGRVCDSNPLRSCACSRA
jgi:hypothetical protein